ncbi:WecB/TagA/CpsF family glycosyltransferase [Algoriphagus halophytocola]|uniref:WecB/TagA/CpsF family glycosyltransferase n=1 Tax=Algoriphagus halophytocola TaxID=2991499 RepID=A0ABY6MIR4_9BACT|nr:MULTISPECIES: WecB/TagA/CpsF family glycosyltransferase [unclassified Algoriphagus]UZD23053.1 WecB/TagA/CpsF family glycosyltransferase [Algoriphagus sp. TR-M5]WBL44345.1 WecB/TagA/CpsF family glycosyltransferase [Algoriphagus sp. TR-M9]
MEIRFKDYILQTQLPTSWIEGKKCVINTINPHSYCIAEEDPEFKEALITSDILIPDGVGIVLASRLLYGIKIPKVAGYDLHLHYLDLLNQTRAKVFYLGSTDSTLEKIRKRLIKEYPFIQFYSYSPPFKPVLDDQDNSRIHQIINEVKPKVLFVGMTAPKQEKWVYQNKDILDVNIICSIGAVFDFYSGNIKRPSKFWIDLGLEWLPRLLHEPRRLWKRTFISSPKFLLYLISSKFSAPS